MQKIGMKLHRWVIGKSYPTCCGVKIRKVGKFSQPLPAGTKTSRNTP
jgi:hypothetical protein